MRVTTFENAPWSMWFYAVSKCSPVLNHTMVVPIRRHSWGKYDFWRLTEIGLDPPLGFTTSALGEISYQRFIYAAKSSKYDLVWFSVES